MAKTRQVVTFIQPRELPSIIWDPDNNCPLVEFHKWTYSTDNSKIIKKLKGMGYRIEGIDPIPAHLHPEGKPPTEQVLVSDDKTVPPRPNHIPVNETQDLATGPKPSVNNKGKKRTLKKRMKR